MKGKPANNLLFTLFLSWMIQTRNCTTIAHWPILDSSTTAELAHHGHLLALFHSCRCCHVGLLLPQLHEHHPTCLFWAMMWSPTSMSEVAALSTWPSTLQRCWPQLMPKAPTVSSPFSTLHVLPQRSTSFNCHAGAVMGDCSPISIPVALSFTAFSQAANICCLCLQQAAGTWVMTLRHLLMQTKDLMPTALPTTTSRSQLERHWSCQSCLAPANASHILADNPHSAWAGNND